MLPLAGCNVPGYMNSIPLPGLGLPCPALRICYFMAAFKSDVDVCRDPGEQHNLFVDSEYLDVLIRFDVRLV